MCWLKDLVINLRTGDGRKLIAKGFTEAKLDRVFDAIFQNEALPHKKELFTLEQDTLEFDEDDDEVLQHESELAENLDANGWLCEICDSWQLGETCSDCPNANLTQQEEEDENDEETDDETTPKEHEEKEKKEGEDEEDEDEEEDEEDEDEEEKKERKKEEEEEEEEDVDMIVGDAEDIKDGTGKRKRELLDEEEEEEEEETE